MILEINNNASRVIVWLCDGHYDCAVVFGLIREATDVHQRNSHEAAARSKNRCGLAKSTRPAKSARLARGARTVRGPRAFNSSAGLYKTLQIHFQEMRKRRKPLARRRPFARRERSLENFSS